MLRVQLVGESFNLRVTQHAHWAEQGTPCFLAVVQGCNDVCQPELIKVSRSGSAGLSRGRHVS